MSETLQPALPDDLDRKAEELMHRVCEKKLKVATAESCTGGLLASLLTDIALSVTGFAGPAGDGNEEGLVHFACALRGKEPLLREEHFGALGRGPIRIKSLEVLLEMLEEALEQA